MTNADAVLEGFSVRLRIEVAWGDLDAFAHVNNTVYFRYFESARIAYFERMAIVGAGRPEGLGPILGSIRCRFLAPLGYPDTVDVGVRVTEVSEDRFTMEYAVFSRALGRLVATGSGVNVVYDYAAEQKATMPDAWRAKIDEIEGSGR